MLNHIPSLISAEDNQKIEQISNFVEIKKVVHELNGNNIAKSDGFTGLFFQHYWDIVGEDVCKTVQAFFCGYDLPRNITHTSLVLIPKKKNSKSFSELGPISLSSFIDKVISKVLHGRLVDLLP